MKRLFCVLTALAVAFPMMSGCDKKPAEKPAAPAAAPADPATPPADAPPAEPAK